MSIASTFKSIFSEKQDNRGMATGGTDQDIFKAFIPWYLYKPPYGFPLEFNPLEIRKLAKNPYIFGVIKTLQDEVASVKWDIGLKEEYIQNGSEEDDIVRFQIINFFNNPNGNDESFEYILRCWVRDISELDAGVGVKVFNKAGKFSQLFARDGGTFLLNPDIYGYFGNRLDFVIPPTQEILTQGINEANPNGYGLSPKQMENLSQKFKSAEYDQMYQNSAAYFQYGWTAGARPVPFGKREIVYIKANPRTDSIYGRSPVEILMEQILTLIYGSEYNLDFYLNNNLPNGLLTIAGASKEQALAYRQQLENQFMSTDNMGNFKKKHFKIPISSYDIKWTPLQMSSKEMQIIEQQKWFTKLVWSCFGVTADEMGFTEDSNRATGENQAKVSKRKAIKPLLSAIQYAINNQIMPEFEHPEYEFKFVEYDLDEEMQKHSLWEQQIRMGVRTAKQIATEELGIDESEFEEQSDESEEDESEEDENSEESDKDKYEKKALKQINLNLKSRTETKSDQIEKYLVAGLKEIKKSIIEDLDIKYKGPMTQIKGYVDVKSKISKDLAKYENFFNKYKDKINVYLNSVLTKSVDDFEKEFNVNSVVNTKNMDFFKDFVFDNINDLNDELLNKLRKIISMGLLNRSSITQIKSEISGAINISIDRAKMIAITETNRAENLGNNLAAKGSGLKLKKYWDAYLDDRTSEICKNLNGQLVGLNEKFTYKGKSYDLPPAHPNCRSRVLYIQQE